MVTRGSAPGMPVAAAVSVLASVANAVGAAAADSVPLLSPFCLMPGCDCD